MVENVLTPFPVIMPGLLDYPIFVAHARDLFAQGQRELAVETLRALQFSVADALLVLGISGVVGS